MSGAGAPPRRPTPAVVSGGPGAGKTTLAHALAGVLVCPAIVRDEIEQGLVLSTPGYEGVAADPHRAAHGDRELLAALATGRRGTTKRGSAPTTSTSPGSPTAGTGTTAASPTPCCAARSPELSAAQGREAGSVAA